MSSPQLVLGGVNPGEYESHLGPFPTFHKAQSGSVRSLASEVEDQVELRSAVRCRTSDEVLRWVFRVRQDVCQGSDGAD